MLETLETWLKYPLAPVCWRLKLPVCKWERRFFGLLAAGGILVWGAAVSEAQEPVAEARFPTSWLTQSPLTGDWGGYRSLWAEHGLTLEFYNTVDVLGDVSGGVHQRTAVLGSSDLLGTLDLEPLIGWHDGTVFLHGLGNYGSNPSSNVGDLQGVNSIAAYNTWKLYEAWFEQDFQEFRFSILGGLYDVNSEFDVLPSASLFLNSAYGINSALGLSGINGPSTFPTTSLAGRIQLRPTDGLFVRAVVADGVPGDPSNPAGTQIEFQPGDGVLAVGEIGFLKHPSTELRERVRLRNSDAATEDLRYGYFGKYAAGLWDYTSRFNEYWRTAPNGSPLQHRGSLGGYVLAEQRVYYEPDRPRQGLTVFARVGLAEARVNPVDLSLSGGFIYTGLLPGRDRDRLGFGVAAVRLGSDYQEALRLRGTLVTPWEIDLEASYQIRITGAIFLQPDFQYVIHPEGDARLGNAVVIGTRLALSF